MKANPFEEFADLKIKPRRRTALTPSQCEKMRDQVLAELQNGNKNTRYFSEKFGVTKSAMSKQMRKLSDDGFVHSLRHAKHSGNVSFDWALGDGGHQVVGSVDDGEDEGGKAKQVVKSKWPPCKLPQQTIFSALGL